MLSAATPAGRTAELRWVRCSGARAATRARAKLPVASANSDLLSLRSAQNPTVPDTIPPPNTTASTV